MCMVKHSLNSVYICVDLFLCASPIRILHMLYPITFGLVYALFNASYFLADGEGHDGKEYTYKDMHWTDAPVKAVGMCFVGFVVAATMQVVLFAVYELRLYVYSSCCERTAEQTNVQSHDAADSMPSRCKGADGADSAEIENILPAQPQCAIAPPSVQIDMEKVSLRQNVADDNEAVC